jgi:hypothetical protein
VHVIDTVESTATCGVTGCKWNTCATAYHTCKRYRCPCARVTGTTVSRRGAFGFYCFCWSC